MEKKKNIDVKNQVTLSFQKSFLFCRKGISYRLFRSSLTLAVVVVAVAFFTVLLSEGLIVRSTSVGVYGEMRNNREADTLQMHLFHRYSSRDLSYKASMMRGNAELISEFAKTAGVSEAAAEELVLKCYMEQLHLQFFKNLSAGKRAVLFKKNTGRDILTSIIDKDAWDAFLVDLEKMRSVRLPESKETLRTFLDDYTEYLAELDAARKGRNETVTELEGSLDALTDGASTEAWIAAASDEKVEEWRQIVVTAGFELSEEKMTRISGIMKTSDLEARIGMLLQTPEKRAEWKKEMHATPGLEEKYLMLEDEIVGDILGDEFTIEDRKAVSGRYSQMKYLRDLAAKLPSDQTSSVSGQSFLDGRQMFLVVISFMVCMVGITNAMLMSITERFREIATMKCLGATDGFILKQFLIEAAIQGVVGGTAGMIIGMIISILKSFIIFGSVIFAHFPGLELVYCAVFTVVVGILLAMFASVYPSRAAASMAPMDAMRVE